MIDNDFTNDNAQFDRLVDGELSATERKQLLASLDEQEHGWRQCALAFVEAQAWGQQFKQIVAEPDSAQQPTATLPQQTSANIKVGRWFAVAAALMVAFSLGWLTKSPSANESGAGLARVKPPVVERQELPLRDELPADFDADDTVTLLVRDTSGKNQRLQVPLMEVEALDDQFAAALPAELRDRFRDRGFDVQRRRRFAPMFFEQNEQLVPMVVPVDDTYLVPVSQPIY